MSFSCILSKACRAWLARHPRKVAQSSVNLVRNVHHAIKEIEPWGILFAVVGLALSFFVFWIDHQDRTIERRLRAWEMVSTDGPYSGGKAEAVDYLIQKKRDLSGAKLADAILSNRDLNGVSLRRTNLTQADLFDSDFTEADFSKAILINANLTGANLSKANLQYADITGARMPNSRLFEADLSPTVS